MEEDRDRISNLPLEIKAEIFSRLPLNQLISLKRVSKRWHEEINSHEFTKLHLLHQSLNPSSNGCLLFVGGRSSACFFSFTFSSAADGLVLEKLNFPLPRHFKTTPHEFVGSCNGLLCFQEKYLGFFRVFNPATGVHRIIPPPRQHPRHAGFGYDCGSDDYKVLSISPYREADIYSMKKGSWKPIFTVDMLRRFVCSMQPSMAVFNNVLYWVTSNEEDNSTIVSCFDLSKEEYNELAPLEEGLNPTHVDLVVIKGCLYIINMTIMSHIDIWVLKAQDKTGVKQSWTKLFRCQCKDIFSLLYTELNLLWVCTSWMRPLPTYSEDDNREILLGFHQRLQNFVLLDLQSGEIRRVDMLGLPDHGELDEFITIPWMPSLVSPINFACDQVE